MTDNVKDVLLVALILVAALAMHALAGCSRTPAPATPKPIDMGDNLVCFFSRAEQKGRTIICGESMLMCEAIRAEEYDRGSEVGPCTDALVSVTVTRE